MDHRQQISADVIGQISLMQSVVAQLPDRQSMLDFVCRGFKDISGVRTVEYNKIGDRSSMPNPDDLCRCFPVNFSNQSNTELIFTLYDEALFNPYIPFIENFCTMLGVIFEEQHQRMLNQTIMADLERRVQERTKALEVENQERKQVARELKRSEERFREFVETTDSLITRVDCQGKLIYTNHTSNKVFGIPPEQCIGISAFEFVHPDDKQRTREWFDACVKRRVETATIENRQLSRTGEVLDIIWTVTFKYDEKGQIRHINSIAKDITRLKELEIQLRQSQKMEAIGTMAGGIAHDFNNILGIILGNSELAIDDLPDWNPASQNLKEIKKASLRAKEIVQQLLSFTRKTAQEKKVIPLGDIVNETANFMRASIPASIQIKTDVKSDIGSIKADPTQIHQVLINLCTNAAHAIDDTGVIKISVRQADLVGDEPVFVEQFCKNPAIHLSVSDNGCGIPESIIERVFDPYFTTKAVGKGTGMGLSVVLGIVKNHDGIVWIESKSGDGTRVNVFFSGVDEEVTITDQKQNVIPKGNETILFVDDETSLLNMGEQVLTRLGYEVITFTDPGKALELFKSDPYRIDLIVTDMTMPIMTGEQLAGQVLEIRPKMPMILCTGYNHKMTPDYSKKIGISHYLEKPLEKRQLAAAVRQTIDNAFKHRN